MSQSRCRQFVRALTKIGSPSVILVFSLAVLGLGHPLAKAQGPTPVSGAVTTHTTWTADGSPYVVTGTVTVYGTPANTVTLTIEPGVEVHFNAYGKLAIGSGTNKGALNAVGTSQSPIMFTSNQTTKTRGYWGRVDFGSAIDPALTLMEYVTVEYGGYGNQGEVYVYSSAPTMRNCTIQESSNYGMYVYGAAAEPVLENTTFQSNANFGVYMVAGSLSLEDMTFANTEAAYAISMLATASVTSTGTNSFDQPIELRATVINTDTTWRNLGAAYVPNNNISVYKNATELSTLTIEPGVEVRFKQNRSLIIGSSSYRGALIAQGTVSDPIVFTSDQTTKTAGYWYDLRFEAKADASTLLEHVVMEYGGNTSTGMLYVNGSSPTVRNTTLRRSGGSYGYGAYVTGAAALPSFDTISIEDCVGAGVYMAGGAVSLEDVTISGTGGDYAISMLATTNLTTTGTQTFDRPIELRASTIGADTTWRDLGAAYVLSGSTSVYKNTTELATLTIEPGVEVRFKQNGRLSVGSPYYRGALIAHGTSTEPIVFTSDQTTKTPGYWWDIRFEAKADASTLVEHAVMEYGGNTSTGMLCVNGSSPTVRNTTLRESGGSYGYGAYVTGAAALPLFDTVAIEDCGGAGIYVAGGAVSLKDMTISGTGGNYSIDMLASTPVTTEGVHSLDKPIKLRYGPISSDLTWHALGAPYVSNFDIPIYKNTTERATLTIEPGVELRMGPSKRIDVGYSSYKGDLVAQGTPSAPIRITSDQDVKTAGYWDSVIFGSASSSSSVLEHAVVEYGGSGGQGPIRAYGTPTLRNCSITNSTNYGVFVSGATAFPDLADNNFMNTPTYAVYNQGGNVIDTRASFWGDGSGPSGSGPGSGGTISANVMFNPWLESQQNPLFQVGDALVTRTTFNKHQEDTALVTTFSASGDWVLTVLDSLSNTVKSYAGSGTSVNQVWNGEQEGTTDKVDDGDYTLKLTATDPVAGQVMAPLLARVTVNGGARDPDAPVGIITSPGPGAVVRASDSVSIQGTATDANDFVSYRVEYGAGITPSNWDVITSPTDITTPVENGQLVVWPTESLTESTYALRLKVSDGTSPEASTQATVNLLAITDLTSTESIFSPNGDLRHDTTRITASITLSSDWTLSFKNDSSVTVKTFIGSGTTVFENWDGKDGSGQVVPDGTYTYVVEATEPGSGVSATPVMGSLILDTTGPTAEITSPLSGTTVTNEVPMTGTAYEPSGIEVYRIYYRLSGNPYAPWGHVAEGLEAVEGGDLGTWSTNDYAERVPLSNGSRTYVVQLQVWDLAGNVSTDTIELTVDNLFITLDDPAASQETIEPLLGETTVIDFELSHAVNEARVRLVPERSPFKQYPDETPEPDAVRTIELGALGAGPHTVAWDGRDDAGVPVPSEAYIFVIEGRTASGAFDKFNQYNYQITYSHVDPNTASFTSEETEYNVYTNEYPSHIIPVLSQGRASFRIRWEDGGGQTSEVWPEQDTLLKLGDNTFAWDGRDASGNLVTDATTVNYLISGFLPGCDPCTEDDQVGFPRLKRNHIIVEGTTPEVPLVSIKSDPYVVTLSYSYVTRLRYHLGQDADVTVTVSEPGTGFIKHIVSGIPQTAGDQEVVWDGTNDTGELFPTEGHYTFTVTATIPDSGECVTRRGNIIVRK